MGNIIVDKFNIIFSFLQDIRKVIVVWLLYFFFSFDFEVILTNFLANKSPEHFTLFLFLERESNVLELRLLLIGPTYNGAFLFTKVVLEI